MRRGWKGNMYSGEGEGDKGYILFSRTRLFACTFSPKVTFAWLLSETVPVAFKFPILYMDGMLELKVISVTSKSPRVHVV
jgi:hypothetical protein